MQSPEETPLPPVFQDPSPPSTPPLASPTPSQEPSSPTGPIRSFAQKAIGAVVSAFVAFLKFGALLLKVKGLGVLISMIVSLAAYTWLFGFPFALGFILLIFVHEMGHVIAARQKGIKASAPMFIPFLGAMITMKEMPKNAADEAYIGIAGPIAGSLAALGVYLVGHSTGSHLLLAIAYIGFFLNLFNLIPILPFDGGRVVAAIHPAVWAVGLITLVILAVTISVNPLVFFVVLLGGFELWGRFKRRHEPESKAYLAVAPRTRVLVAVVYIGLILALLVGMTLSHVPTH